jgi:tRNA modification GTPase
VAVLRVEGPNAAAIVAPHLRGGQNLLASPADTLLVTRFGPPPGEEVVVHLRSAEVVEIDCHGGAAAVAMISAILSAQGCCPLAWREWLQKQHADPITAAAALALAGARTERAAAILLDQYHGALRRAICEIESALARGDRPAACALGRHLLARAQMGRHLVRPWKVVVAGRPNVGKSSLVNALAGFRRAISHPLPGTTRDPLATTTVIDGWLVELVDTAGLRTAEDELERAGIARAEEKIHQADLLLLVLDRSIPRTAADEALLKAFPNALLVENKCDLPAASPPSRRQRPSVTVSALRGDGIEELLRTISARLVPDPPQPGEPVPFTDQQVAEIAKLIGEDG